MYVCMHVCMYVCMYVYEAVTYISYGHYYYYSHYMCLYIYCTISQIWPELPGGERDDRIPEANS
jgi:hypothetical protein